MARGRKAGRQKDERVFSFRLDAKSTNPVEVELRKLIEAQEQQNEDWSLRNWVVELYTHHRGYSSPNNPQDVADAIVEATNGLWQVFNEIVQSRPQSIEDYREIEKRSGIPFNDEFMDGMMNAFGKVDDKP